jgi:DNA-binding XRE family transcriptional regulator
MLEVTKKPHTKNIQEVRYIGPPEKIEELAQVAKSLGLEDVSGSVPWRELFPDFDENISPSIALRGARGKENLTQKELSHLTGIPQGHISEMENGKRAIGRESAKRFGKALNINYKVFL